MTMAHKITSDSCRVCLNINGSISIFETQENETLADIITKCSSVLVGRFYSCR